MTKQVNSNHRKQTWREGHPIERLSVFDRALQYGDGFFTTMLVVDRAILNWSGHWRRLRRSAERLQFLALDERRVLQQITQAVEQFDVQRTESDGCAKIVKILVSRGEAGRGYAIPINPVAPRLLIQISTAPIQVVFDSKNRTLNFPLPISLRLETCQTQAAIQAQLAGLKHLNRLDSVLAQTEVQQKQQAEGIMLNAMAHVIGGTQSNLFLIQAKTLITPKLHLSGVAGTTRYQLSQLATSLGFDWQEAELSLAQVCEADELFLTNAIRGIMPIQQLNQQIFSTTQGLAIHTAWNRWQAEHAHFLEAIQ